MATTVLQPTAGAHRLRHLRLCWQKFLSFWRYEIPTEDAPRFEPAYHNVTRLLYGVVMISLGAVGIVVLSKAVTDGVEHRHHLQTVLPNLLGGIILAVIILELLETVFRQVKNRERLTFGLVNNFLIIGAVAAVRHILVIGAQLSITDFGSKSAASPTNVDQSIRELYANVVIVSVLLAGMWLIRGLVNAEPRYDRKTSVS